MPICPSHGQTPFSICILYRSHKCVSKWTTWMQNSFHMPIAILNTRPLETAKTFSELNQNKLDFSEWIPWRFQNLRRLLWFSAKYFLNKRHCASGSGGQKKNSVWTEPMLDKKVARNGLVHSNPLKCEYKKKER